MIEGCPHPGQGGGPPLAVVTSYLVLILAIAAIFSFVVPKLVESIQTFALNLGGYLANVQGWYNDISPTSTWMWRRWTCPA